MKAGLKTQAYQSDSPSVGRWGTIFSYPEGTHSVEISSPGRYQTVWSGPSYRGAKDVLRAWIDEGRLPQAYEWEVA